jgi:YesN/AraC family two-component response regulator
MIKYPLHVKWDLLPGSENIEITPSGLAKSMFFYVQAVGRFVAMKEYYTHREHFHSYLLLYTRSGCGILTYRGKSYSLQPGSIMFIDCKEEHRYSTDGIEYWDLQWVHFNGANSQSYYEQVYKNAGPVLELPKTTDVPELLDRLLAANRARNIQNDILSSKWLVDVLTELLLISLSTLHGEISYMTPPYILEIMNQMERNCTNKITLEDLAAHSNFSKYHLAREFKRYTGYSPTEYVTNLRITLSKEMLQFSNLSIGEIAEQCGYENASFFIRMFKKKEGLTPLEFRKTWR